MPSTRRRTGHQHRSPESPVSAVPHVGGGGGGRQILTRCEPVFIKCKMARASRGTQEVSTAASPASTVLF